MGLCLLIRSGLFSDFLCSSAGFAPPGTVVIEVPAVGGLAPWEGFRKESCSIGNVKKMFSSTEIELGTNKHLAMENNTFGI